MALSAPVACANMDQPPAIKASPLPASDVDDQRLLDMIGMRRKATELNGYVQKVSEKTPSMLGSGYAGNYVIVVEPPEYAPGDDIIFSDPRAPGGMTLHRITHAKPGFVYTKGTFNSNGDGWIPLKDVKGKIAWPKPKM